MLIPLVERRFRPLVAAPHAAVGVHLAASTLGLDAPALGGAAAALDTIDSVLAEEK
jgi:hypothetical protein